MSRNSNYSRTIREAAEKIPDSEIDSLPHIIEVRRRAEKVEARHQELCARHQKMRKAAQALEARIEELKAEVANKRAALPGIAFEAFMAGDLEVTGAVEAREELQRMTWQIGRASCRERV